MASMKTALFVFLHWVLQCAVCRDVSVPPGTLYRVAGFPLSLPCAVSGFEGPRTQDFEWFLYRDDAGGRQMGVVSTRDKGFPYAPFQPRVKNGEVRVERDSGDKVRLVIQRLRAEDQGKYECYTPSTDSTYQGNYSASVPVKAVIYTCRLEIISIDKLLGVVPGRMYKKRYDDGEITLEKRNKEGGLGEYVMKMRAVQPDDTGSYFCESTQWIRDPDRSWQKIAQRTLDIGNLTVQQLAESLSITSSPRGEVTLQVGAPLILTCEVLGLPAEVNSGLLVQWMRSVSSDGARSGGVEMEVARMSPDGVVSWGDNLSRASGGSMEKVAGGRYTLKLFSGQPLDSGVYRCVVSVYAGRANPDPSTPVTLTQRSEGVTVNLKSKDVLVAAVAQLLRGPLLKRGNTITLICNITVTTTGPAQAQVQWMRWPIPPRVFKREESAASAVTVPDPPVGGGAQPGVGSGPHGGWYNTGARAESNAVTVYMYSRAEDLLLIPLVVGVSSALFVGILIISTVTCCFMKRLAKQRTPK
ncbi:hypothetical protein KUCAC02_030893 [Chaenocephalus aceratus]|uniref:Uncharacterized protein n=1 Tax=Chaenocephalus aceratus TaxID=36190 RepID=A0ACB9XM92_CHAAC|nr:hypothetical protein KUCAC02_030893 [Chaenocephalus aceratus]